MGGSFPIEFPIALVALCFFAAFLRDGRMSGTAATLLINWGACAAFKMATGEAYPFYAYLAIDWLSAISVLIMFGMIWPGGPTLWQFAIGLLYIGMIVSHAAVAILANQAADYYGYYFLKYASWAQAAVVTLWGGYALAGRYGVPLGRLARLDPYLGSFRAGDSGAARLARGDEGVRAGRRLPRHDPALAADGRMG